MSRYIDAEFEINHYTSMTTHPTPDVTEQDKRNSLIILNALQMAKSIEIIRCRECKYAEYRADFDDYECRISGCGLVYDADDFCSYGEREGE